MLSHTDLDVIRNLALNTIRHKDQSFQPVVRLFISAVGRGIVQMDDNMTTITMLEMSQRTWREIGANKVVTAH